MNSSDVRQQLAEVVQGLESHADALAAFQDGDKLLASKWVARAKKEIGSVVDSLGAAGRAVGKNAGEAFDLIVFAEKALKEAKYCCQQLKSSDNGGGY